MQAMAFLFLIVLAVSAIYGSSSRAREIWPSLQVCVKNQIPLLDDGISSADVIATGATLKCREVLAQNCKCDGERLQDALAVVKTETIPYVLEYRASKRALPEQGWWTTQGDIASCEPLPAGGYPLVAVEQLQSQGENPLVHTERDSAGHITVLITVAWRHDVEAGRHVASQFYFFSDYGTCQKRLQALIAAGLLKAPR